MVKITKLELQSNPKLAASVAASALETDLSTMVAGVKAAEIGFRECADGETVCGAIVGHGEAVMRAQARAQAAARLGVKSLREGNVGVEAWLDQAEQQILGDLVALGQQDAPTTTLGAEWYSIQLEEYGEVLGWLAERRKEFS